MTKALSEEEKWWRRVKINAVTGCHEWQRYRNEAGYGQTRIGGRLGYNILAHRFAWIRFSGQPIPKRMGVLHSCDNPACCNPKHLFLGTQKDNIDDMCKKGRWGVRNLLKGAQHPRATAKLSAEQVLLIRKDTRSQDIIAKEFGVTGGAICRVRKRQSYTHIPEESVSRDY